MTFRALLMLATIALATAAFSQRPRGIPLRLQPAGHAATVTDLGNGEVEVRTVGVDPYILCEMIKRKYDAKRLTMFSFEYMSAEPIDFFEVYMVAPDSGWCNASVSDVEAADDWTEFAVNARAIRPDEWNGKVKQFRIDFGGDEGNVVRVRNIRLRAMTADEAQAEADAQAIEARRIAGLHEQIAATMIAPERITDTSSMIAATHSLGDTHIAVVGKELDLATQLRESADALDPAASLPPALVVGEGPSEKNHTIVRILNRHHICEVQFLAYPPDVTGGVHVCTGAIGGEMRIVTAPISDPSVRELRVFSRHGNWIRSIDVPDEIAPPFVIAVGDSMADEPGDEIAVASVSVDGDSVRILVLSGDGERLGRIDVAQPERVAGAVALSGAGDSIIAYVSGRSHYHIVRLDPREVDMIEAGLSDDCTGVYAATTGHVASVSEPQFSHVDRIDQGDRLNVGERENLLWVTVDGAFDGVPEGEYIKHSRLAHIRTDFASPHAADPDFTRRALVGGRAVRRERWLP